MNNAAFVLMFLLVMPVTLADITFGPNGAQEFGSSVQTSIDVATKNEALRIFSTNGLLPVREYLNKQLDGKNDLPHHDLLISDWLIQSGRLGDAVPILERLAADSPPRKDIHYTFAWIAIGQGRIFDAATHVEQIEKLPFETEWSESYRKQFTESVRELKANIAQRRGDWKGAFEIYSSLIATKPGSISLRSGLARAAFQTNNLELAQKNLRLLEQANQPPILAEIVIAKWFEELGKPSETEEWFRKSLDRGDPDAATREYCMWLLRTGRPSDVAKLTAKLSGPSQKRPEFIVLNVQAEQMMGQFAKTLPVLQKLTKEDDNLKSAKLHLAWGLSDSEQAADRAKGVEIAQSLMQQVGESIPIAVATLAWAHYRAGNQDAAWETLRNLQTTNLDRDVAFFLAKIREARGEKELAQSLYEAIAKSKGEFYHITRMPSK